MDADGSCILLETGVIPAFREDGYLPEGVHTCAPAEATYRFGSGSKRRKRLVMRLRRWIELI
jgi:hypothetical protein